MKIAIVGAGFTGLSAAYELSKTGHEVFVFEKDSFPGGLAVGYKEKNWKWSVEKHYHHWFTNDKYVLGKAEEINYNVVTARPKTSSFYQGKVYQLDSPINVLKFNPLPLSSRIRMGLSLAYLKYNPFWRPLEKYRAYNFLLKTMGVLPYKQIWEPLLINKFGKYYKDVPLSWFWARIKKRTPSLAYPEGGFLNFAQDLVRKAEENGVEFYFNAETVEIKEEGEKIILKIKTKKGENLLEFDKVIVTLSSYLFTKITLGLPQSYKGKLLTLKGLGAINLVLRLSEPFLRDGTYWLNICDTKFPFMAIVEHTNFMDKKYYNNEHIVYIGKYLPQDHSYMKKSAEELIKIYDPFLIRINKNYKLSIIDYKLFKAPFAQPIIPLNYSRFIPSFKTPLKNVYLANIEQVYPWDRGTNYAVELGQKIAKITLEKN